MENFKNYFFFGASSKLAQLLIANIIKNQPNARFFLFSIHTDKILLETNCNTKIYTYKSLPDTVNILNNLSFYRSAFFLFQALPEEYIQKDKIEEYFYSNSFSQIHLINYIKNRSKVASLFFISSILSGFWYSKKKFYATSKYIVEQHIRVSKFRNIYILKLPPFKSNLFSNKSNRFFNFSPEYIAKLIFCFVNRQKHNKSNIVFFFPFYFKYIIYFLNSFISVFKIDP